MEYLTTLGFSSTDAIAALRVNDADRERALDWLAQHPPSYAAVSPAKPASSGPPISLTSLRGSRGAAGSPAHLTLPPTAATGGSSGSAEKSGKGQRSAATGTPASSGSTGSGAAALSRSVPNSTPTFSSAPVSSVTAEEERERKRREEERRRKEAEEARTREAQAARQREEERVRLFAELNKQEEELKRKEKEARLSEVEEAKRRREEEERQRRLQSIQKAKEQEEERRRELTEREERKREKEKQLSSVDEAMAAFVSSYDTERVHSTCRLLLRVLSNAMQEPGNDRLRQLRLSNEGVQRLIVRPVFGLWLLKKLGWEEEQRDDDRLLAWKAESMRQHEAEAKEAIARLQQELQAIVTAVPAFFSSLLSSSSLPAELLCFVACELRNSFVNVVTSPTERNFCSVDTQSASYRTLFAPLGDSIDAVWSDMGYRLEGGRKGAAGAGEGEGAWWVVEQPQVRRFEAAVLELSAVISSLRPQTALVQAVASLLDANRGHGRRVKEFVQQLIRAGDAVLADPHEQKYHRLRLDRLYARCGGRVRGGAALLQLLGFKERRTERKEGKEEAADEGDEKGGKEEAVEEEEEEGKGESRGSGLPAEEEQRPQRAVVVSLQYPGFDAELLRLRVRELERAWKAEVERRRLMKEQQEEANDSSSSGRGAAAMDVSSS